MELMFHWRKQSHDIRRHVKKLFNIFQKLSDMLKLLYFDILKIKFKLRKFKHTHTHIHPQPSTATNFLVLFFMFGVNNKL